MRDYIFEVCKKILVWKGARVVIYRDKDRMEFQKTCKEIRKKVDFLMNDHQAYLLWDAIKNADKLDGVILEAGVYQGGSALLFRHQSNKLMYLFDTFEGLVDVIDLDNTAVRQKPWYNGQWAADYAGVKKVFQGDENTYITKGIFPASASFFKQKIAFCHLDMDTYKSTKDGLEFIWDKMVDKGIIIIDDYSDTVIGVKTAVDEFMEGKKEHIFEFLERQGMIIKNA